MGVEMKDRTSTLEMYQWKARINIIGSKQVQGVHQSQMYSPIVAWPTTRFFSIQSLIHGWYTKQLDFVMAFPQAKVERESGTWKC